MVRKKRKSYWTELLVVAMICIFVWIIYKKNTKYDDTVKDFDKKEQILKAKVDSLNAVTDSVQTIIDSLMHDIHVKDSIINVNKKAIEIIHDNYDQLIKRINPKDLEQMIEMYKKELESLKNKEDGTNP